MIEIKEVITKKDKKIFAKLPLSIYKDCPYYVPSIFSDELNIYNPKKNFSLKHNECKGFLAYKDGKVVGRILGLINKEDNKKTGRHNVRFSRIDAIEDIEVFKALLGAVEKYGKQNGLDTIHGPWGFNDTDREGLLTFGFKERSTYATNYSYEYYHKYLEQLGFKDESKWVEKNFIIPDVPYDRVMNIADRLEKRLNVKDVAAKPVNIKKIVKNYGDKWFETYNEAYSKLDGFVPVEEKEKKNVLKQFATIINPQYFSLIVNEKEEVVAFGVVLPSICKPLQKHGGKILPSIFSFLKAIKHPKELEMALIGIKDEYKNSGVNSIVIAHIMKNVIDNKIQRIESNPMLETNLNIQYQWKFAEGDIIKRRQTYIKLVGDLIKYCENK
ncbi:MAG: hypothetical protein MJ066_04955 [Clostridia bacterium]|nr:hypothetical protein [Clostridia bacterium]